MVIKMVHRKIGTHALKQPVMPEKKEPMCEPPAKVQTEKRIIVIRHGHDQGRLTEYGASQIRDSAEKIKMLVSGRSIAIWSSPIIRTKQSAEILGSVLGVPAITEKIMLQTAMLRSVSDLKRDLLEAPESLIILVTHEREAGMLSEHFLSNCRRLKNGEFFEAKLTR